MESNRKEGGIAARQVWAVWLMRSPVLGCSRKQSSISPAKAAGRQVSVHYLEKNIFWFTRNIPTNEQVDSLSKVSCH